MSNKTQKKFQYNPAKELTESIRRVARWGIDPGATIRYILGSNDVAEGEVVSRLEKHDE